MAIDLDCDGAPIGAVRHRLLHRRRREVWQLHHWALGAAVEALHTITAMENNPVRSDQLSVLGELFSDGLKFRSSVQASERDCAEIGFQALNAPRPHCLHVTDDPFYPPALTTTVASTGVVARLSQCNIRRRRGAPQQFVTECSAGEAV
eukprot:CAMPEP_0115477076 /NCGR_PEP_ID=MMETSP0271-20121206/55481_1 /TAXON_ID=71861 /ORGANISM="Scrippsiella trochoidea, Strain CCMP3099" /LENGTH=148 /DNA_ID=CAMNT_0002904539 /DNA_START=140 /DNA_END=587 /DNA_ORIENTATION=-